MALALVIGVPSSKTRPRLGIRTPEMTSKRVVLPAPFGPISPTTSPAHMESDTSWSAAMPPKLTPTSSSSRTGTVDPLLRPAPVATNARSIGKTPPSHGTHRQLLSSATPPVDVHGQGSPTQGERLGGRLDARGIWHLDVLLPVVL